MTSTRSIAAEGNTASSRLRLRLRVALGCTAVLGCAIVARGAPAAPETSTAASEPPLPSAADDALRRLQEALERDPGVSPETRRALLEALTALRSAPPPPPAAAAIEAAPPPEEKPAWALALERLAIFADLRLRHESSFDLDGREDRHRERLRARVGATYQLVEEVLLGVRLSTGSEEDPRSPHVTFGDVFDKLEVSLDRAFVTYRPRWLDGTSLTLGKFAHPFFQNPVYGELVWDADVQPEGATAGLRLANLGIFESLELNAGEYIVLEQANAGDALATVAQLRGTARLLSELLATLAVGYYFYTDVTPEGGAAVVGENAGNATVDLDGDGAADDFASDFAILNPVAVLTFTGWSVPISVAAEYILNTEAVGPDDQGWGVGATVGRTEKQGDVRVYYQWQVVERDAVFSPLSQDDFLLATNHRSHVFGVNYQVFDKLGVHVWALVSRRDRTGTAATDDSDKDQWRVRLDINIRF